LEEAYSMMQRYIGYLQTKSKNEILYQGLGDWYDIGPKEPGNSQLTPRGITATAFYYYDLNIISKISNVLGKEEDAGNYAEMASKVKTAYNKTFFNKTTKQYGSGSQTANAVSVYMGLVEPPYKDSVVKNIVTELQSHKNKLSAGDIGYRYLLRVLDDNGRSDVIYDMNSNSDGPGYGYQLSKGATALTESWQAYTNSSNNHMMLGHLKEWFFSGLAGIRYTENAVAFRNIEIRPQPVGEVTSAKATYMSPYGLISSDWKKRGNIFELATSIPANAVATIILPANRTSHITESGKILVEKNIKYENGNAVIKIGSGKYRFRVDN
jgi:alpha-L-rhamnosidase